MLLRVAQLVLIPVLIKTVLSDLKIFLNFFSSRILCSNNRTRVHETDKSQVVFRLRLAGEAGNPASSWGCGGAGDQGDTPGGM